MPDADHDPFEERLADVLRDTGATFGTDQQTLAARGETHGRRLRSRRRAAAVVGGAAAVALVGLGGALLLPDGQGDGVRQRSVAAGPAARASVTAPETTAATVMSGDELVRTLEKLLPEGQISNKDGGSTDNGSYANLVYDDGDGEGAIAVSLNRVRPGGLEARQTTQCPDKLFIVYDSCTSTKLSDGSVLMLLKGYEYPNSRSGTKRWAADLVTSAGGHIGVQEWNSATEKGSPVTRDQPPLDLGRLKALATAHELRAAADALPLDVSPAPEPDPGPLTPGGSISAVLTRLVPPGVKVVSRSGPDDDGFGYVVLDDGRGTSLVQVNVQLDTRGDMESELFGPDAEVLPDGTKVVTRRESGEKGISGIVQWSVDTIRPDHRRVVISAFNSGAQNTPATRKAPALTMEQLKAIATDPGWSPQG
ncbi:hypothetical protein [Streptomyces sp. 6-11-2]|uniref:hypothetical protein n=1 Tax=unclassified Streptomyces TaxID=2593676 RepID=UPI0011426073|nr:hypothetical protein [Streptomyces sp. 6-11-2]